MKTDEAAHTPAPWSYSGSDNCIMAHGPNRLRFIVATIEECFEPDTQRANAARIVLCVNSHDALLAACNDLLALCRGGTGNALQIMERAESAIRKATP